MKLQEEILPDVVNLCIELRFSKIMQVKKCEKYDKYKNGT
jgi:hypothetical protein